VYSIYCLEYAKTYHPRGDCDRYHIAPSTPRYIGVVLQIYGSSALEQTTYIIKTAYMRWLRLVGSLKLQVSFAKEPFKRDAILQKRPVFLRRLLIGGTPYHMECLEYAMTHRPGGERDSRRILPCLHLDMVECCT